MNTKSHLTKTEALKIVDDYFASIEKGIEALLKEAFPPQALMLKTADDINLHFGDEVQEASQIGVGTSGVKLDSGALADGEYTMPDGVKLVIKQGVVKEIIQPSANEIAASIRATMATLRAQVKALKATTGRKPSR